MKKYVIILLAFVATYFVSCNNVIEPLDNNSQAPAAEGKTITFSATIDVPQTKASLDGLNIKWSDGDYIGVATDNSATIVAYPVSNISEDGLSCSLQVNAVEGATTYYAVFRGSLGADSSHADQAVAADNFSSISFDTSTKTFSGLTVGASQVAEGSLTSHLWYENGYPLSMAGKSSGNTLVMKPCLALIKLQIDSESVPTDNYIVTETYKGNEHSYSAVRGFDFYQRTSSSLSTSGDFTVTISDDNTLTVAASGNNSPVREKANTGKLTANTPYYMCVIPGGEVSSFRINFLGYSDDTGTTTWDAVYQMNLVKAMTVYPGAFIDLGTLNPLGRKKAKNHAADDEAASAAVKIDGQFGDWATVTNVYTTDNDRIVEWKYTYDDNNIYFLYKVPTDKISFSSSYNWGAYIDMGFNTDNRADTGKDAGGSIHGGYEAKGIIYPWRGTTEGSPTCLVGEDGNGHFECPIGTTGSHPNLGGAFDGTFCYVEVCVPRTEIGSPTGNITVNHSMNYSPIGDQLIYIGGPIVATIDAEDQTLEVGQSVAIGATTNSTANITYTSNNPSVATVDSDGLISGVAVGSTTITMNVAAVGDEYTSATKTINVTVTEAFIPAIEINGDFNDWNGITEYDGSIRGNGEANTRVSVWKVTSDARNIYVYMKLVTEKLLTYPDRYIGIGFDTDQNDATGSSQFNIAGCEKSVRIYPAKASISPVEFITGSDPRSRINSTTVGTLESWGVYDNEIPASSTYSFVEVKIPRADIGLTSATTIKIATSYDNYDTVKQTLVLQ